MKFSTSQMLPLIMQLGDFLKKGVDHYADMRKLNMDITPDVMAVYLTEKMRDWHPKVGNTNLLDNDTRLAAARFIAGVALNLARA